MILKKLTNGVKMKILKSIMCSIVILAVTNCGDTVKAEIKLNTIQCGMCSNKINSTLNDLDGIVKVNVSLKKKVGYISYDATMLDLETIENAISSVGYDANDTKASIEAYNKLDACCRVPGK